MRWWGLILLAACGPVGGITESCDFRPGEASCVEYQHSLTNALKQTCGQGGGKYTAGPCDRTGTVGACHRGPTASDATVYYDWYYPPKTAADVMAACQNGTFVAP